MLLNNSFLKINCQNYLVNNYCNFNCKNSTAKKLLNVNNKFLYYTRKKTAIDLTFNLILQ